MVIPNPHIFREYDIRGEAERDLPSTLAYDLGRALGTFWGRKGVKLAALARDCRLSSPRITDELRRGILETGCALLDLGMVPSPMMYFMVFHRELGGGVMVTGSHNPPQDNGLKMMIGQAVLSAEDIAALRRHIEEQDFDLAGDAGSLTDVDPLPEYLAFLRGNIALGPRPLKVAIDAGSGAAGPTALAALQTCGVQPTALLCEPDGHFPVHHPDPSMPENTALLRQKVLDEGLDVGIAYDGDGDRIGVIDSTGRLLFGDQLLIVLSRHLLKERPGACILGEVKCSQTLYDDIAAHGGRGILWKTGHSLIKKKMKEEGALLAGEMSGHVFFGDRFFGFDDAVYATLRLLELLSHSELSLEELLADVPETVSTPELRVPCDDRLKFQVVAEVREKFSQEREVITVDGARILFEGGWGLVRASNTQAILVLRFEAQDQTTLDAIRAEVEAAVHVARQAAERNAEAR